MKRFFHLLAVQLRTSVAQAMAYRADFIIQGFMSILGMALTLLPLFVLFDQRQAVRGWDRSSALIVMAYFMAVKAVMEGIVSPSLVQLVERIRSGAFDYVLLKPVDAQIMVSASRYEPWRIFDFIGAVCVATYALVQKHHVPGIADVAAGIGLFVAGVAAMYSLWIMCAAASFWVVRLDNLTYLLGAIFDTARWPVQIFRGAWRFVFTFVIPVAVMTTFPAMALLGTISANAAAVTVIGAICLLLLSRWLWTRAIASYTSASS